MRVWQSLMYLDLLFLLILIVSDRAQHLHPFAFWGLVFGVLVCAVADYIDQELEIARQVLSKERIDAVIDGEGQ